MVFRTALCICPRPMVCKSSGAPPSSLNRPRRKSPNARPIRRTFLKSSIRFFRQLRRVFHAPTPRFPSTSNEYSRARAPRASGTVLHRILPSAMGSSGARHNGEQVGHRRERFLPSEFPIDCDWKRCYTRRGILHGAGNRTFLHHTVCAKAKVLAELSMAAGGDGWRRVATMNEKKFLAEKGLRHF